MNERLANLLLMLAEGWERRAAVVCNDPLERETCDRARANADRLRKLSAEWLANPSAL